VNFENASVQEIARNIYFKFELGQSCKITGMLQQGEYDWVPRGVLVLQELRRLDRSENCDVKGRRYKKVRPNSIGGYVAQKMFIYKHESDEHGLTDVVRVWRVQ